MAKKKAAAAKRSPAGARGKRAAAKRPAAGARAKKAAAKRPVTRAPAKRAAAKRPAAKARAAAPRELKPRRQPETLRLRTISPSLTADDLGRSLAWYRDVLGFIEGQRWENEGTLQGVELRAGSCTVFLSQDDFAKGRDRQKGIGFRLYCETTQDVDAIAARIRAAGGTLDQEPKDDYGMRQLVVTDPDGFKISIFRTL